MKDKKKVVSLLLCGCLCFAVGCGEGGGNEGDNSWTPIVLQNVEKAKNVILFIGDGMGPEQIQAGEVYSGESLCMQQFPYHTFVNTESLSGTTDSAASATALSTGVRTTNGYVGKDVYKQDLQTIVDIAKAKGMATGIIATEPLSGATPMAFAAHSESRNNTDALLESAAQSGVNLFLGDDFSLANARVFTDAGYTLVEYLDDVSKSADSYLLGVYSVSADAPSQSADISETAFDRLVLEALDYLSQWEEGFFLMAEGSHIDHGGHANDMSYMLSELLAFDTGIKAVLKWAENRNDTVVIVTADHETGGLNFNEETATKNNLFDMTSYDSGMTYVYEHFQWTTQGHTATEVSCYINGANVDFEEYSSYGTAERIKNIDIFQIMKDLIS